MLCALRKWRLSKTFDTGKPMSLSMERHLRTCRGCRNFTQLEIALQQMKTDALAGSSNAGISYLSQRIIAAADAAPAPENLVQKRTLLFPVLTSVFALTALVLGVLIILPPASSDLKSLNPLSQWGAARSTVSSIWQEVQSPYQREWDNLRSSLNAAADFFQSFVELPQGNEE